MAMARRFKFAEGDATILALFRLNPTLQSIQIHRMLKRGGDLQMVRRRLQALRQLGYLRRMALPDETGELINRGHFVHFLTGKGWSLLQEQGVALPPKEFRELQKRETGLHTDVKSNKKLPHEQKLTDLYLRISEQFPQVGWKLTTWERLNRYLYHRFGDQSVNPDVYMSFETSELVGQGFWEVENTHESKHDREGKSSLVRKLEAYEEYFTSSAFTDRWGAENGRVYVMMRTEALAWNLCKRLHAFGGNLDSERWYVTWDEAAERITDRIFLTPRTFRNRPYSLGD